jgi:cytoskeletal protein CcmA (bactofilin family)
MSRSGSSERSLHTGGGHGAKDASLSIIATGTRVVGEVEANGVLKIEGFVSGTVRAEHEVLVAHGGAVEGDIPSREAVIGGDVVGSIFADERVEVQERATVHGDVITRRLIVHEGGEVNGTVRMGDPTVPDLPTEAPVTGARP